MKQLLPLPSALKRSYGLSTSVIPVPANSLQSLEHNDGVSPNDLKHDQAHPEIKSDILDEHTTMPNLTFSPPSFSSTASSSTIFKKTYSLVSKVHGEEHKANIGGTDIVAS
jgi:hypothetical protein